MLAFYLGTLLLSSEFTELILQPLVGNAAADNVSSFQIDGASFQKAFGVSLLWEVEIVVEGVRAPGG